MAVLGGVAAQPAAATTLVGENLNAESVVPGQTLTVNCAANPTSPFTYHAQGVATGPHIGTFTEDGTFDPGGSTGIDDFHATFTITSAQGNVTGEKFLPDALQFGSAFCNNPDQAGFAAFFVCYRATFADGSTEEGLADVGGFVGLVQGGSIFRSFGEVFFAPERDPSVVCGDPCDEDAQANQDQDGDDQGCKDDGDN